MALAKDHMPSELTPNTLLLSNSFHEDNHGSAGSSTQVSDLSSQGSYAYEEYKNTPTLDEEDINNMQGRYKPDSISVNPKPGFSYNNNRAQDVHSLINFKSGTDQFMQGNESLLSFEQSQAISNKNEAFMWKNNGTMSYNNQLLKQTSGLDSRLYEEIRCGFGSINTPKANMNHGETGCSWLYSDSMAVADTFQEKGAQEPPRFHKRPYTEESTQALKKQCTSTTRSNNSPKAKDASSKDPQSIAAKNRRERISERLKVLQELIPNGTKVDLVTMLEKALSYVKFLQLQVKVLATDEFWPAQGGKASDIAQVKEAIDAILCSHRDRNSSSSSK